MTDAVRLALDTLEKARRAKEEVAAEMRARGLELLPVKGHPRRRAWQRPQDVAATAPEAAPKRQGRKEEGPKATDAIVQRVRALLGDDVSPEVAAVLRSATSGRVLRSVPGMRAEVALWDAQKRGTKLVLTREPDGSTRAVVGKHQRSDGIGDDGKVRMVDLPLPHDPDADALPRLHTDEQVALPSLRALATARFDRRWMHAWGKLLEQPLVDDRGKPTQAAKVTRALARSIVRTVLGSAQPRHQGHPVHGERLQALGVERLVAAGYADRGRVVLSDRAMTKLKAFLTETPLSGENPHALLDEEAPTLAREFTGLSTLVHEEVHGYGPQRYDKPLDRMIEEFRTEATTRHVLRTLFPELGDLYAESLLTRQRAAFDGVLGTSYNVFFRTMHAGVMQTTRPPPTEEQAWDAMTKAAVAYTLLDPKQRPTSSARALARLVAKHLPGVKANALQAHWARSVDEAQGDLARKLRNAALGAQPLEKAKRKSKADAYLMAALHIERDDTQTALALWRHAQRAGAASEELARLLLMAMNRPRSLARQMNTEPLEKAMRNHEVAWAAAEALEALEKAKRARAEIEQALKRARRLRRKQLPESLEVQAHLDLQELRERELAKD